MSTGTRTSRVDSHANQAKTTTNYGQQSVLIVDGNSGGSAQNFSYINFSLPDIPDNSTVGQADLTLTLSGTGWAGGPHTLSIRLIQETWQESKLKWSNRPNVQGSTVTYPITAGAAGDQETIDISTLIQDVVDGTYPWFGIRISVDTSGDKKLHSAESATTTYRPKLELQWDDSPRPPTDLRPTGGLAVSTTTPTLSWRFIDFLGNTSQANSQVQVDNDSTFASTVYDSGDIANTTQKQAVSGLSAGVVYYWRVRVRDGSGLQSDWSDTGSFIVTAKGTFSLTEPTGDILDLTPDVTWLFTPASLELQARFRVSLYEQDPITGVFNLLYDSGPVTDDTTNSVPIPERNFGRLVIKNPGRTYRVNVKMWDDVLRYNGAAFGDPDYYEDEQVFTYARAETVSAPILISVEQNDSIGVVLTWLRYAHADAFAIRVTEEGKEARYIETKLDPNDISLLSGNYQDFYAAEQPTGTFGAPLGPDDDGPWTQTNIEDASMFRYTWYGAKPSVTYTYEIEAFTDGFGYSDNTDPTDFATDVIGIWLVQDDGYDPAAASVFIADKENADLSIGDDAATFTPIGRRDPINIVSSVRGYEGSVGGRLITFADRDTLEDFAGKPYVNLRLALAEMNIAVIMGQVTIQPTPDRRDIFEMSASVFQVDDFTFEVRR